MLRRLTRLPVSAAPWRSRGVPLFASSSAALRSGGDGSRLPTGRRGLLCNAAVNAHDSTQTAVDSCLERVLVPSSSASPCAFAVIFFEGHDPVAVQNALRTFADRRPEAPPVIGCSVGDGAQKRRPARYRTRVSPPQQQEEQQQPQSSSSPSKPTPGSPGAFRSPTIVTVLGLGFPEGVEALPVSVQGGCFPSLHGEDSISRVFALPREKQPLFFMLGRGDQAPASDLEDSFRRLGNLLPGGTRLSALSSGAPPSVVSSFPARGEPVVGVCLLGSVSVQEQAELARKTLGAFGLKEVSVSGGVCDELFVPSTPAPAQRFTPPSTHWKPLPSLATAVDVSYEARRAAAAAALAAVVEAGAGGVEGVGRVGEGGAGTGGGGGGEGWGGVASASSGSPRVAVTGSTPAAIELQQQQNQNQNQNQAQNQNQRQSQNPNQNQEQGQGQETPLPPQQLGVFKVEDFVFPGMTRRFRVFEPRYRALVKRCLSEGEPLLILPLSRGGNTVGTAVYVSGLDNVEDDGRCEIEITGIARCNVKTMWTKGESFGLSEAVVEYFGDVAAGGAVATAEQAREAAVTTDPLFATAASDSGAPPSSSPPSPSDGAMSGGGGVNADQAGAAAAEGGRERAEPSAWMNTSGEVEVTGIEGEAVDGVGGGSCGGGVGEASDSGDSGGALGGEGAGESGGPGRLMSELPELERLRIEVSVVLQREIFRTRKQGRSPLWPGWNGMAPEDASQQADPHAFSSGGGGGGSVSTFSGFSRGSSGIDIVGSGIAGGSGGGGGGGGGAGGAGAGGGGAGGLDPCDLDAEALSYWAAQNVEADVLTKHRWLSCTSTEERLREIRDVCRVSMARYLDRNGVDGGVLSKPLSALHDLLSR